MLGHLNNIKKVLSRNDSKKWNLIAIYLRLSIKYYLFYKILKIKIKKDKIFGISVYINNYPTFVFLFEEIFIQRQYYFTPSNQNSTIIDCGSNIGLSLIFFKIYYPNASLICFEPEPTTFNLLHKNVHTNHLQSIQLHNLAIYKEKGFIDFYKPNPENSTLGASINKKNHSIDNLIQVPTCTLSEFINHPIDFIKMDIEGAETLVLQELSESKKLSLVTEISIEYHHHLEKNEDSLSTILLILESNNFGYHITDIYGDTQFSRHGINQDILIRAYNKTVDSNLNSA